MGKRGERGGRGSCMIWTDRWAGDYRLRGGRESAAYSLHGGGSFPLFIYLFSGRLVTRRAPRRQPSASGRRPHRQACSPENHRPYLICLFLSIYLSPLLSTQARVLTSAHSSLFICLSTRSPPFSSVCRRDLALPSSTGYRTRSAKREALLASVVRYIRKRGENLAEIIDIVRRSDSPPPPPSVE